MLFGQRAKALGLTINGRTFAQSAYPIISAGNIQPGKIDKTLNLLIQQPSLITKGISGAAINVDVVNGNDSYAGTSDCPEEPVSGVPAVNNDEIIMTARLYHDNVPINGNPYLVIRAATGATVVFDGTRSIQMT